MKLFLAHACILTSLVLALPAATAAADAIFFGHADGVIEARDEFDLLAEITLPGTGANHLNFGGPTTGEQGIFSLAIVEHDEGHAHTKLISGHGYGTTHVRLLSNMNDDISHPYANFTGNINEPVTGLAVRSDGGVYVVDSHHCCSNPPAPLDGGAIFVRDPVDMTQVWPGVAGDGGYPTGTGGPLLAVEVLSNDNAVIGSNSGELNVLSAADLGQEVTTGQILFGPAINDIAVLSTDVIVVGLASGQVSLRQAPDLTQDLGTASFGSAVRSLAVLAGDKVAIGLDNGEVHVRDSADIAADLGNSVQFNLTPILSLATTSSGNLVIADAEGPSKGSMVYVRDPDDVAALAPGVNPAADGAVLFSAASIQAMAVVESLNEGSHLLLGDANNDHAVTADDLIAVQQNFGTTEPGVPPWPPTGAHVGDADDDGAVTADDLITVQQNFGNSLGPAGAGSVPEPAAAALFGLGSLVGLRRRR